MHTILISIGSNIYSRTNIDKAKRMLLHFFPDVSYTSDILTKPDKEPYVFPFRNILGTFQSELSAEEVTVKLKQVEAAMGRSPKDKTTGRVVIDIDLVKYDEEILRPEDYECSYIQNLINAPFN